MSNYLTFQGSLTPADSTVQEGESIHRSGNEEPLFTMQTSLPKGVRNFLRSENFSVRFDSRKQTFTLTHKTIKGYVLHDMTADEVLDYAVNHCHPGYDPDPTPSNILPITLRVVEAIAFNAASGIQLLSDCTESVLNSWYEKVIQNHSVNVQLSCSAPDSVVLNHGDYRDGNIPNNALIVSDPPFGIGFRRYDGYDDSKDDNDWLNTMSGIKGKQAVLILPWERTCLLIQKWGMPDYLVTWVYNSNQPRQSRLVTWWGCKPDLSRPEVGQEYKNPEDPRIAKRIVAGKLARRYDRWNVNLVKGNSSEKEDHPCQVPEEIIRLIVQSTAQAGQHICDPFLGSGTTGVVARRYGYSFTGWDLSKKYVLGARKRIMSTVPKVSVVTPVPIAA